MADNGIILVTGASGFIGGWLVETLYLNGHAGVRAGIRSWSSAARLARFPLEIVLCDVMNTTEISQAMAGATTVIHCATGLDDVIVQGTHYMLAVALKLGIKRFVHLSTAEVYGNVSGDIDETVPLRPMGSSYGDAKIKAEELCWQFYERGLPVTVLRPSIVYGPFSKAWTLKVVQNLQSGNWGLFERYGEGVCNLVYIADAVAGILLAARHDRAIGQAFNLNGPERITWNHYFQRLNAALGYPALKAITAPSSQCRAAVLQSSRAPVKFVLKHFEGPLKKIYASSRAARAIMQRIEKSMTTTAGFADLSLYNRKAVYLSSKAQQILGYQPRIDLETGLQMSVGWLKLLGLVS